MGVENERADAGRDCGTYLARPSFQEQTGTGKHLAFLVQVATSRMVTMLVGAQSVELGCYT